MAKAGAGDKALVLNHRLTDRLGGETGALRRAAGRQRSLGRKDYGAAFDVDCGKGSWLYPSRSTVTGSSRAARWAGSHAATTPTATRTAAALPNVTGSRGAN